MIKRISTLPWQLIILIALAIVRGLIYLALFPPWVAPDEPAHFEVIRIIGQEQQLPSSVYYKSTPINSELSYSFQTFRMWELLERSTPSQLLDNPQNLTQISFFNYPYPGQWILVDNYPLLPHTALSPLVYLFRGFDIATELYMLRFVSIILMTGVVTLAWLITKRVFPQKPQFWLAIPAFVIFLPMHTHIFASVNTDVFAIVLTSVLLLLLISFFDDGILILKVALVVVLLILALFTKRTVIFTWLWVGFTVILYLGYRRQWPAKRIALTGLGTIVSLGAVLIFIIFNADLLTNLNITLFNMNIGQNISAYFFASQNLSPAQLVETYIKSGLFAFITFWGNFGGATINIPWPWAWGLMIICAVIIIRAIIYLIKLFKESIPATQYQRNALIVFVAGTLLSLANAFFPVLAAGPRWGPPARYFFPVIIPIATFFFLGVRQLCPPKYRDTHLLYIWLAGLITYDTLVVTVILLPFLYG